MFYRSFQFSRTHLCSTKTQCLRRQTGVLYMAGKKHYFGVGGGTRQFLRLVDEDGNPTMLSSFVAVELAWRGVA